MREQPSGAVPDAQAHLPKRRRGLRPSPPHSGARIPLPLRARGRAPRCPDGAESKVVRDVFSEDGQPVEVTDDWYAQDSEGNIWCLGVDGAQPGVILPADPEPGITYRQEY